jgi:hypothetical protein
MSETTQQTEPAAAVNGALADEQPVELAEELVDRIARDVVLVRGEIVEINMRLAAVQMELALLAGLVLLAMVAGQIAARRKR